MALDRFNDTCNALLSAANHISPTGKEQRGFWKVMDELKKNFPEEKDENDIFKRFIGYMLDGLAYGNWPQA